MHYCQICLCTCSKASNDEEATIKWEASCKIEILKIVSRSNQITVKYFSLTFRKVTHMHPLPLLKTEMIHMWFWRFRIDFRKAFFGKQVDGCLQQYSNRSALWFLHCGYWSGCHNQQLQGHWFPDLNLMMQVYPTSHDQRCITWIIFNLEKIFFKYAFQIKIVQDLFCYILGKKLSSLFCNKNFLLKSYLL